MDEAEKKVFKLVIDRNKWFRGQRGKFLSTLRRREDGKMCCLGFLGVACGVQDDHLDEVAYPLPAQSLYPLGDRKWPEWLFGAFEGKSILSLVSHHEVNRELALINDDQTLSDVDREERLKILFAANGVEVEFVN